MSSFLQTPSSPLKARKTRLYAGEEVILHTPEDFKKMQAAGKLASQTLDFITPYVKEGVTTEHLNTLCHDFIITHGATPAPLNYRGFPKSICTSVNHVVCHGIPSDKKILKSGDILNIDVTVILDGWFGDTSRMFSIGKTNIRAQKLINAAYEAMMRGIEVVKPGATLGDIGAAIETTARENNCSVVRDFCGHGLGQTFHAPPNILNYGTPRQGLVLEEGMFFTVEPMLNAGRSDVKILSDGWTAVTRDMSLSAQWEHSIAVTSSGFEIFTSSS